ncbi:helix-turn-helix transcriptional regulator [Streptomyces sodiiphilus]|uniref:Helix-turn-helix transcriptional regulator n=1 Tax=Streptomyces sodiiphilus TaxID=226217 RepID=A0ABN2PKR9_9ACTN
MLLRRRREEVGLTLEEVARHLECHKATISRLELGRSGLRARDLRQLLELYGVTDEERVESYVEMSRQGRKSGWWERHASGLRPAYTDFIALEAEAVGMRSYQPLLIPGLLQTPAYARCIIAAHPAVVSEEELERRVEVRLGRQALLAGGGSLTFRAVIGEAALRSGVGGESVMRAQVEHLLEVADRPNVDVQVLPLGVGEHPGGSGPFVIFTFPLPEESHVVCEEGLLTSVYLDSVDEVRAYASAFDALCAAALSPRVSCDMLAELVLGLK